MAEWQLRPGSLDAASLRTLRRFANRLGLFAAVALCVWGLAGARAIDDLASTFRLACTFGAIVMIGIALRGGETPSGASLNHWDEGLALNCLGLGLHVLQRALQ